MPPLRRPSLPPGDLQKLNEALNDLHLAAGWPSVREMASALDKKFSYPVIHDVFSKATGRAPRLDVLLEVVEYLASRVRKLDVEETVDRFDAMWRKAAAGQGGAHRLRRQRPRPNEGGSVGAGHVGSD